MSSNGRRISIVLPATSQLPSKILDIRLLREVRQARERNRRLPPAITQNAWRILRNVSAYLKSRSDLGVGFAKAEARYAVLYDVCFYFCPIGHTFQ